MTLCYCTESTIHMCKCNHWLCSTRACLWSVGGKIAAHVYIVDGRTTPKYLLDRQRHSTKAYKRRNNYKLGLGEAQAPPPHDVEAPSNWTGIGLFALLFWTPCCCNWRLLVVVFCIVDISLSKSSTKWLLQAYGCQQHVINKWTVNDSDCIERITMPSLATHQDCIKLF